MKKMIITCCTLFAATLIVSCNKQSNSPSSANITGTYTFVSMDVSSISSAEVSDASGTQKTVTTSNYTTENNNGTVTIDASTMTSSNISYTVNTTSTSDFYVNGTLQNNFSFPFNFTAPPSSGTSTYKVVSADSLYFENGTVFMNGVTQQSIPSGARISMDGNILYMTGTVTQTTKQVESGETLTNDINIVVKIKLQRQ